MPAVASGTRPASLPAHWSRPVPDRYTPDDLIDAYLMGHRAGRTAVDEIVARQFEHNLTRAADAAERVITLLRERLGVASTEAWLRADTLNEFSALLAVPRADFLAERFVDAYALVREHRRDAAATDFRLDISFVPASDHLNRDAIDADGYTLTYQPRLEHALHNERACHFLGKKPEYSDWVVTTAFYAAVHFVEHRLFPREIDLGGRTVRVPDVDAYRRLTRERRGNHAVRQDLAEAHCPEVADAFRYLRDLSQSARYVEYRMDRDDANRAKGLMVIVKAHCAPASASPD